MTKSKAKKNIKKQQIQEEEDDEEPQFSKYENSMKFRRKFFNYIIFVLFDF